MPGLPGRCQVSSGRAQAGGGSGTGGSCRALATSGGTWHIPAGAVPGFVLAGVKVRVRVRVRVHFHGVCFLNISVPLLTPRLRAALPAVPSPASSTAPRFSRLLHPSRDQFLLPSLCIPRCCRPGNTTGKEQGGKSRSGQPSAGIPKFLHHSLISADIQGPLVSRCILTNDC